VNNMEKPVSVSPTLGLLAKIEDKVIGLTELLQPIIVPSSVEAQGKKEEKTPVMERLERIDEKLSELKDTIRL